MLVITGGEKYNFIKEWQKKLDLERLIHFLIHFMQTDSQSRSFKLRFT